MTARALEHRRIPAEWTDVHRAQLAQLEAWGLPTGDAVPEWQETTWAVVDVDGLPAGLVVTRDAVVTNCPIPIGDPGTITRRDRRSDRDG